MSALPIETATVKGRRLKPAADKHAAPLRVQGGHVEAVVRALSKAGGIEYVRSIWLRRVSTPPPPIQSADLLARLLAWQLQVAAYGDLDEMTAMRLVQVDRSQRHGTISSVASMAGLETGTILVREWRNVEHRVLVLDDGFEHQGQRYRSLSEVARTITGTKWSGPRFFGVAPKP